MRGPGPFTTCMDRLDEVNLTDGEAGRPTNRQQPRLIGGVALLEVRVKVLIAMVSSMGRGVSLALDVLGLDHRAARADLDDAASA